MSIEMQARGRQKKSLLCAYLQFLLGGWTSGGKRIVVNYTVSRFHLRKEISICSPIELILSSVPAHLISKAKVIKSSTNCTIQISGHDTNERMRITIESYSKSKLNSIKRASRFIEKALVEYLADEHSEKRLLYDLAVSAIDSYQPIQRDSTSGLLQKEFFSRRGRAFKEWWRLFELPCGRDMHQHDLSILEELKVPKGSDCKIEVFKRSVKVPLASPYVLVSGTKQLDVKNAAMMVADAVRRHQRCCQCHPRWWIYPTYDHIRYVLHSKHQSAMMWMYFHFHCS